VKPVYVAAPLEWAYELFPLPAEGEEILSLEWVAEVAHSLFNLTEATGDEACFGPTLHWAHRFVITQSQEGDWPLLVNARTGEVVSTQRTRKPVEFLARLGDLLDSSEFEHAVARAAIKPGG
jgi:hypothetical protein